MTDLNLPPEARSEASRPVRIVDVDMPFGSMVRLMVKWSIAAIPAVLILTIPALIFVSCVGSMLKR